MDEVIGVKARFQPTILYVANSMIRPDLPTPEYITRKGESQGKSSIYFRYPVGSKRS